MLRRNFLLAPCLAKNFVFLEAAPSKWYDARRVFSVRLHWIYLLLGLKMGLLNSIVTAPIH